MSGASVYILTTEGPVAIQRISEEDPSINSVICLDGLAQILPVSPAYDAFVRRPVGVIERMTGHGSYRMDVASRIDEGRSWQLAAYVAHAARLQAGGGDINVYATGEVDSELGVRPVERVDLKLESLARHLAEHEASSEKSVILIPDGSAPLPDHIGGIPVVRVNNTSEALAASGIAAPPPLKNTTETSAASAKRRISPLVILLGATVIAAALFWVGGDFARWSALTERGRILELEEDITRAEDTVFGVTSTGAANDLIQGTELARRMVTEWGMSDRVGPMAWGSDNQVFLGEGLVSGRDYSDDTARIIDEEVERILRTQEGRARQALVEHRGALDRIAAALLDKETITGEQVAQLIPEPEESARASSSVSETEQHPPIAQSESD